MSREYIWFIVPICGLLWALGGTFKKQIRRIGVPSIIVLSVYLYLGWSWWLLALFSALFGTQTLPFTLIGDSIHKHWFNWFWIWITGLVLGLPCIIVGILTKQVILSLWLCLITLINQGIVGTLSNIKFSSKYFPWKMCETLIGISYSLPYAMLIGHG